MKSEISENAHKANRATIPISVWIWLWSVWFGLAGFISGILLPGLFAKTGLITLLIYASTILGVAVGLIIGVISIKSRHHAKIQYFLFMIGPMLFITAAGVCLKY